MNHNDIPITDLAREFRHMEKLTELALKNKQLKKEIAQLKKRKRWEERTRVIGFGHASR